MKNLVMVLAFVLFGTLLQAASAHTYIKNNDTSALKAFIANGGDVNKVVAKLSPLHYAIKLERTALAKLLIEANAKIVYARTNLLYEALRYGQFEIAQLLIEAGAIANAQLPMSQQSILYTLLLERQYTSVVWLLQHNVDYQNSGRLTPFALAVSYAPSFVIEAFLAHPIKPSMVDEALGSVLAIAIGLNRNEIASMLVAYSYVNSTLIRLAIEHNSVDVVAKMLDKRPKNLDIASLWQFSMLKGSIEILTLLLDKGITITQPSKGKSLLYYAMKMKRWEIVEWLWEHQSDFSDEVFTLYESIKQGDINSVVRLLEKGVSAKRPAHFSYTPLLWAFKYKHFDIAKTLLEHNTSLDGVDSYGEDALFKAVTFHQNDLVHTLLEHNVSTSIRNNKGITLLQQAIRVQNFDAFTTLLQKEPHAYEEVNLEEHPITLTIKRGLARFFYPLLNEKIIHKRSVDEETLLHLAAKYNRHTLIPILLFNGADIHALNAKAETALVVAAKEGSLESVSVLAHLGADITYTDSRDISARGWAIKNNHRDIAKWLENYEAQQAIEAQKKAQALQAAQLAKENNASATTF